MANRPPKVYYRRMIVFVMGLLLLFISVMTLFYHNHKSLLLSESNSHLDHIADLITDHLTTLEQELEQRVSLIHSNVLLQQYMFVVARLEGELTSFQRTYKEQIGNIQGERTLVLTIDGLPLVGGEHEDLINFLSHTLPADLPSQPEVQYIYSKGRLEMLARVGIFYKDQPIGQVAVGRPFDKKFLQNLKLRSGSEIFLTLPGLNGQVLQSTLKQTNDLPGITSDSDIVTINDLPYYVQRITIKTQRGGDFPELWLGVNQQKLFTFLNSFLFSSVAITLIGGAVILAFGIYLINMIIRPIQKLVDLTQSVTIGKLPEVREVIIRDEMDYLTSGFYSMVAGLKKQREKLEEAHELLLEQSITDPLTGLYNRRYFNEVFPKMHSLHKRKCSLLHILLMDIDHFKEVNDTYGHACGDKVIVTLAEILKNSTRKSDFCFRIGGEEFVLLLSSSTFNGAITIAERIRTIMGSKSLKCGDAEVSRTVSIGLVEDTKHILPDELMKLADKALYNAKKLGRNQVCIETT